MKNKIKQLANNLIDYSIELKPNETILIEQFGTYSNPLVEELKNKINSIGGKYIVTVFNYQEMKEKLQPENEELFKKYAQKDVNLMKSVDAYIGIRCFEKTDFLSTFTPKMLELYNKYYIKPVHLEERVKNTKWCILRYPNEEMAKRFHKTLDELEQYFFDVCTVNYQKMSIAMDSLKELLNNSKNVRIVGKNTNLSFSIEGIPAEKYAGTFNIPDGEVATAPVKNSVNGYITYNTKTTYNGIEFENIRFEFKDGKIINATANKTEELNKILDTDDGARYIGEFAFGLNPYITETVGDTLFDEKVCGSFHFTPGDSLEESDNGNRSSIHWDIVCIQTAEYGGGEIYLDNKLIRKDGKFVLDELLPLNRESLLAENVGTKAKNICESSCNLHKVVIKYYID